MTNNNRYHCSFLILALILSFAIGGCLQQKALPLHYHTLSSVPDAHERISAAIPDVMLGPIEVASTLDQKLIVRQKTSNSLSLAEQHRWAGDLPEMITDVLLTNLSLELGSEKLYTYLHGSTIEGLQVEVYFLHFEGDKDGLAKISARWKVSSIQDQTILYSNLFTYTIEPETNDYDGLAKGLSLGLSHLSKEIVKAIINL